MIIDLLKASEKDIPLITELAHKSWNAHYPEIISQEQINYMLDKMYSSESLLFQMKTGAHAYYLVRCKQVKIGFVSISSADQKNWMLHKFYLLSEGQQKGIGTIVFGKLIQLLDAYETIRLTVNRQNYKSINFYFKNGFVIEKVADFDIGNGFWMNDFVMVLRSKRPN